MKIFVFPTCLKNQIKEAQVKTKRNYMPIVISILSQWGNSNCQDVIEEKEFESENKQKTKFSHIDKYYHLHILIYYDIQKVLISN